MKWEGTGNVILWQGRWKDTGGTWCLYKHILILACTLNQTILIMIGRLTHAVWSPFFFPIHTISPNVPYACCYIPKPSHACHFPNNSSHAIPQGYHPMHATSLSYPTLPLPLPFTFQVQLAPAVPSLSPTT